MSHEFPAGSTLLVKGTCVGNFVIGKSLTLQGNPTATLDGNQASHTVLISGVHRMQPSQLDVLRRFTWAVDIFYDQRVKLVLSAEAPAEDLVVRPENPVGAEAMVLSTRQVRRGLLGTGIEVTAAVDVSDGREGGEDNAHGYGPTSLGGPPPRSSWRGLSTVRPVAGSRSSAPVQRAWSAR